MRRFFLFAALILSAALTQAQSLHLGIKGGANLTKIEGESFKDGYKLGYQLGGFAEIDLSQHLGIQPEVLFSQSKTTTGTKFSDLYDSIGPAATNKDVKLNYLNIPILLRINAGKLLTFNVGPQFSILMNDHKDLLDNGKDAFKSGDFAMVAGAQINLNALRIYGRYNIGLSNINDIDNRDKWKNQQLQLGIGFRLL